MKFVKEKYIKLDILQTQKYIKLIKDRFERELAKELKLVRVSAPIFLTRQSGLQDDLSGVERPVKFDIKKDGTELEIVQSLAKWKRVALKRYKIEMHKGLYTDMTAIRRDDKMDQTHSLYVDQWDWEKVIDRKDRKVDYLKQTVRHIVKAISTTAKALAKQGFVAQEICEDVHFITAEELLQRYPDLDAKAREDAIAKEFKTVFIIGIGDKLSHGMPHDDRAPDYDDWTLDGDLMFYHEVLGRALELSSMGIRVDKKAMLEQIEKSGKLERKDFEYHRMIIAEELPLTIGGGIGQSRLCQLLLGRAHIGEVQSSYWDAETIQECTEAGIELL